MGGFVLEFDGRLGYSLNRPLEVGDLDVVAMFTWKWEDIEELGLW